MITGINESKTLTKHISCKCKCRINGKNVTQINGGITVMFQNDSFWNTATCSCTIFSNYV